MPEFRKLSNLIGVFFRYKKSHGFKAAFRRVFQYLGRAPEAKPIDLIDPDLMFCIDRDVLKEKDERSKRTSSLLFDASQVEKIFPEIYEDGKRILRYSYVPARLESRGLVVYFHGWGAHLPDGPFRALDHYDLLAPWDTFGLNRQGSWFWGEKGDNFVEVMIDNVVDRYLLKAGESRLYYTGLSMGGFGALYHGFKRNCDGIYVLFPQVDLKLKIEEYGFNPNNPYCYLINNDLEEAPDLLRLADSRTSLPPLFLIQNQYDSVNYFADHAFRLLRLYNQKRGWYGLRVYPAIGHVADYNDSLGEAVRFFDMIREKNPAHANEFHNYKGHLL